MHSFAGQSLLWDRVHRVLLGNEIELEVTRDRAEILIGSTEHGGPKEPVVFTRPAIVHAYMILAQVMEEQGAPGQTDDEADQVPVRWIVCPLCDHMGGRYDNFDVWHDCDACGGAGLVAVPLR